MRDQPSHYDLGEIRTESAVRPTPPEKKERLVTGEQKTPRKTKASLKVYLLFEFFSNSYPVLAKEFLNNEFALAN